MHTSKSTVSYALQLTQIFPPPLLPLCASPTPPPFPFPSTSPYRHTVCPAKDTLSQHPLEERRGYIAHSVSGAVPRGFAQLHFIIYDKVTKHERLMGHLINFSLFPSDFTHRKMRSTGLLACVMSAVVQSAAFYRESGWKPQHQEVLRIEKGMCVERFVANATIGRTRAYHTMCKKETSGFQELRRGINEEDCTRLCYERDMAVLGVDVTMSPALNIANLGNVLQHSVTVSHTRSEGICMCAGLNWGPYSPAHEMTGPCDITKIELPLACLLLSEDECRDAPPDSCVWDGACCLDNAPMPGPYPPGPSADVDEIIALCVAGICLVLSVIAAVILCRWARRNREAGTTGRYFDRYGPFMRRRATVEDSDLVDAVTALYELQKKVDGNKPKDNADNTEMTTISIDTDEKTCVVCLDTSDAPADEVVTKEETRLRCLSLFLCGGPLRSEQSGWITLNCNHTLHFCCLKKWFVELARKQTGPACPVCRAPVEMPVAPYKQCTLRVPDGFVRIYGEQTAPHAPDSFKDNSIKVNIFQSDTTASVEQRVLQAFKAGFKSGDGSAITTTAFELDFSLAGERTIFRDEAGVVVLFPSMQAGSTLSVVRKGTASACALTSRGGLPLTLESVGEADLHLSVISTSSQGGMNPCSSLASTVRPGQSMSDNPLLREE